MKPLFQDCDDLFMQDRITDGYQCVVNAIATDPIITVPILDYLTQIYDDESDPTVCTWLHDQFIDGDEPQDAIQTFLLEKCPAFQFVYHGTPSIQNAIAMDGYVCPKVGDMVETYYGADAEYYGMELPELVFGAFNVRDALKYTNGQGALLKLDHCDFEKYSDYNEDRPLQAEPSDFYTDVCVPIEGIIWGRDLRSLYQRKDLLDPSSLPWQSYETFLKQSKQTLDWYMHNNIIHS